MAVTLDVGLIVVACIIPFLLVFFHLVVMAHYIDPEAAAGHFVAKLAIVRTHAVAVPPLRPLPVAHSPTLPARSSWAC